MRVLIVANRLPVSIDHRSGKHRFTPSVGGLATGLASLRSVTERVWIGWAEGVSPRADSTERDAIARELRERYSSEPIFLSTESVAGYYHGFSNRTIWPLFHYFGLMAEFDPDFWRWYERVNRRFRDAVLEVYQPGDVIWVQDYQLMLLPQMLREKLPDAKIGFFLHIPFPSYEMFRLLPWRRQLLEGLLGAGLVGFHTHDYVRHFLGSVKSLLGMEDRNGRLHVNGRVVVVDAFPMGIDYDRYASGVEHRAARRERNRIEASHPGQRIVLSIDRMDYTKGIPDRLRAFDRFLERHPEWRHRVTLVCVAVPSRSRLESYRELKREVDRLIGDINGRWGSIEWTPIRYLYRSLPINALLGLYAAADVTLVTPVRDGMNLIAKEYIAAHHDRGGVLVLSEMAGAARELTQAIIVNPNDEERVADAMAEALEMPVEEQQRRNRAMQVRLRRYDVDRWAEDFLARLEEVSMLQLGYEAHLMTRDAQDRMLAAYEDATSRLLLFDYDGTLVAFDTRPESVAADTELRSMLAALAADPRNTVIVISGRDHHTLDTWLGDLGLGMVAEHGAWFKEAGGTWGTVVPTGNGWKDDVRHIMELMTDRTPGSFIEEKELSIAWHYRAVQPDLAKRRREELIEAVGGPAQDFRLSLLDGNKVFEVMSSEIDKGRAASRWLAGGSHDFVLAAGDDVTDEGVFEAAPPRSWTIKVGPGSSRATFAVATPGDMRSIVRRLVEHSATDAAARGRESLAPAGASAGGSGSR